MVKKITSEFNSLKLLSQFALSSRLKRGFTIIELVVVISIIGILATIVAVSYSGWQTTVATAELKSDLATAATAMESYRTFNNSYPTSVPSTFTSSPQVIVSGGSNDGGLTFCLNATSLRSPSIHFYSDSSHGVQPGSCDSLTIGTQIWAKTNLNVGTMVTGVTAQTNNSILEKYCYNNLESNCTTYGGLYQWGEAMQYVTTQGAQGICPTGSHIPTDNDWKILEVQLGMTQAQADATGWRGTDQGTQLKSGGSSGLSMPLAGARSTDGSFVNLSSNGYLWSSSESSTSAWRRVLGSGNATVDRATDGKAVGFSVRCVGN